MLSEGFHLLAASEELEELEGWVKIRNTVFNILAENSEMQGHGQLYRSHDIFFYPFFPLLSWDAESSLSKTWEILWEHINF